MKPHEIYIVYGFNDFEISESLGVFSTRMKADARIADAELTDGENIQCTWYPRFEGYHVIVEEVQ
jgi:hypothetical protein